IFAVHDRDRRAPVALAADQPVAQAIIDRAMTDALLFQPARDDADRFVLHAVVGRAGRRAIELTAVDHHALARPGFGHVAWVQVVDTFRLNDDTDWQVVLAGELKVALVMRGHSHDRAAA